MTDRKYNVLFLCTGNSARSIMAESILTKVAGDRFTALSAGSNPTGVVNPMAIKVLKDSDYPTEGLRSKSWEEFAGPDKPELDFVFTVCDNAAGETCPVWPGQPMSAHWGVEDPAAATGNELQRETAFVTAFKYLHNRINLFAALPLKSIERSSLRARLKEIGESEGSTSLLTQPE